MRLAFYNKYFSRMVVMMESTGSFINENGPVNLTVN
jgi:hypothetical protein